MTVLVRAVLAGKVAPLGRRGVASGIDKRPVAGRVGIGRDGLAGDEQGDRKHHGGPDKAIHHFPFEHYAAWRGEVPSLAGTLAAAAAFGENISTEGMTEAAICIGDVYRLGTALVEVSQGRQPCWRLNERFADPGMARRVQDSGRTGWYYRVVEEGEVEAGDAILLLDRPAEGWTLARIQHLLYRDTLDRGDLAALAALPALSASWQMLARLRLHRCAVEDWSHRLDPPEAAASGR
jgi:MOSC domain-containing protein YiiM